MGVSQRTSQTSTPVSKWALHWFTGNYATVNSGYSWNQGHKISVSSRKQKTLSDMPTRNSGEGAKKKKNTFGKTVHCYEKSSDPFCTKDFSKIFPSCRWIFELLTLLWLIFVLLLIVFEFMAVICLVSRCFCLFACIMFLPIKSRVPSETSE